MSTQPYLCRFSYQRYVELVRPTFQQLLIGRGPEEVLQRYQIPNAFLETERICPKDDFRECTCFTNDLQLNSAAKCIGPNWHDSPWLHLFEKMLLADCITEAAYLPKRLHNLQRIYAEEFAWLGLGDAVFGRLLQRLCNHWGGTWINVDNAGVCGYLSPAEALQFHQRLSKALAAGTHQKDIQTRLADDVVFAEFCSDLARVAAITARTAQTKDGLLWAHDLEWMGSPSNSWRA